MQISQKYSANEQSQPAIRNTGLVSQAAGNGSNGKGKTTCMKKDDQIQT